VERGSALAPAAAVLLANPGGRNSSRGTGEDSLAGGKGPFHKDFQGGFALRGSVAGLRRGGVAELRADGSPESDDAAPSGGLCSGAGKEDIAERSPSASPRSSHSESESVSQNRPDGGRRTAAAASISVKGLKGSRKGGWRSLAVMRSNLARVERAIVTGMAPHRRSSHSYLMHLLYTQSFSCMCMCVAAYVVHGRRKPCGGVPSSGRRRRPVVPAAAPRLPS
jgi:hypothetical protein